MWKAKVKKVYASLNELESYDRTFGIANRCGFNSPAEMWKANPTITGSANPQELGVFVKMNTYRLTGSYRQQNAIGASRNFVKEIKAESPRQAMDSNRENLYCAGFDHILHKSISVKTRNGWQALDMLTSLGYA